MSLYKGTIIEESLKNKSILKRFTITSTKISQVTEEDKTPWVEQWTLHKVQFDEEEMAATADKIAAAMDDEHGWYADFKNSKNHYIIFRNKTFVVSLDQKEKYQEVKDYGVKVGIPIYQLDFNPPSLFDKIKSLFS